MINFFTSGGGSGQIRGHQIANKIKGKVNPTKDYENEVCIFIKDYPISPTPSRSYVDVVEDSRGLRFIVQHPEVGVIASSKMIYDYLRLKTLRDDIVFIPQHHCNFERYVRPEGEVKVAGIIGSSQSFQKSIPELREKLKKIGIKLKTLIHKKFRDRKEVCDFYKTIDVQLIYRTDRNLRNPLKLINAMSFGIPTVAYPEPCFMDEFPVDFIHSISIDEMVEAVKKLKENRQMYLDYAIQGVNESQDYHIDFISELYKQLK